MNLLLVTDAWHPQINGVVRTLTETIDQLQKMGLSVLVIHPGLFRNVPLPFYPDIKLALPFHHRLKSLVGETPPEFIHIATEGPLGWAVRALCIRENWAFSTAFHTHFPQYLHKFFRFPKSWTWAMLRTFHERADCVMVATPSLWNDLIDNGFDPSLLSLWSRGVDTSRFHPEEKTKRSHPVALYVGRISAEKSVEDFLRVNRPVSKWIVGDGPDKAMLMRKYPDATWLGWQQGEILAKTYSQADVFVFPSLTDTFGLVMMEALASGVPVAAYPVPGPLDVVVPGTGFLDWDLEKAVDGALNCDPVLCRKHAITQTWEKCTRQFLQNLIPITNQPRNSSRVA